MPQKFFHANRFEKRSLKNHDVIYTTHDFTSAISHIDSPEETLAIFDIDHTLIFSAGLANKDRTIKRHFGGDDWFCLMASKIDKHPDRGVMHFQQLMTTYCSTQQ